MKKINYAIEVKSSYVLNGEAIENTSISQVADVWSPEREEYIKRIAYNGEYTIEDDGEPEPEHEPTAEERIFALETENHLLNQQITALTDQNDFQEELIVELANIVYA